MAFIQQEMIRQRQIDMLQDAARQRFVSRASTEAREAARARPGPGRLVRSWREHRAAARAERALVARATTPLRNVPLFAGLPRRDLALLQRRGDRITLPEGAILASEQRPDPQFVVLVRGMAEATIGGRRVGIMAPGDHFGELTLVNGEPVVPTITTITDVEAVVFGRREFWGVLHAIPILSTRLAARVAEDLRQVRTRASEHARAS